VGVLSETPESICFAVHHQLPTVPHPMCQDHDVPEVAQPGCAADRHVKTELHKKIRGIRALARHAENSPRTAAQGVADDGLASRTVRRDAGKYPLEPPGVPLDQKLPRMAASVERGMAAHPAALLKRRARLRSVWHVFQKAFAQRVIRFRGSHQIAHRVKAATRVEEAQSQLLTVVDERKPSGLPPDLLRGVTSMEKLTIAFAPHRFEYLKQPLRPRTNTELARLSGRLKKSRRHITGRQTTQAFILREGRFVAILVGLPETTNGVDAFARRNAHDVHQLLNLLRQPETRRQCWYTRRDLGAYLPALEQPWGLHE
jgi:hypothetical protein